MGRPNSTVARVHAEPEFAGRHANGRDAAPGTGTPERGPRNGAVTGPRRKIGDSSPGGGDVITADNGGLVPDHFDDQIPARHVRPGVHPCHPPRAGCAPATPGWPAASLGLMQPGFTAGVLVFPGRN